MGGGMGSETFRSLGPTILQYSRTPIPQHSISPNLSDPFSPVQAKLFLPDRHILLEPVDHLAAAFEGLGAVGARGCADDRGFPGHELAETVNDGNVCAKLLGRGLPNFAHRFQCHLWVSLILEVLGFNSLSGSPNVAEKDHDASARVILHKRNERTGIERLGYQLDMHPVHASILAPCRRQTGNLDS